MTTYTKPLPTPDPDTQAFWDGCRAHRLLVPKCLACGAFRWPPRPGCPRCHSTEHEWVEVSGRGKVYSYVIFRRAFLPEFRDDVPYVVAIIELEESPTVRILSNVVGRKPEEVAFGMPVRVVFEDVTGDVTLFKFGPA